LTNAYDSIKHQMPERRIKIIKNMSFFMREWLENYYSKVFPNHNILFSKGYNYDSPQIIPKNIFDGD
jgi:hypothetical protein